MKSFCNNYRLHERRASLPSDQGELHEAVVRGIHSETVGLRTVGRFRHEIFREHGGLRLPAQGELFRLRQEVWILEYGENIPLLLQQNASGDCRCKV